MADRGDRDLAGKRVVVTRAPEQASDLTAALEARGAQVLLLPVVSFAPPEDWEPVDRNLRRLGDFYALVFLGANAVRYVFGRAKALGIELKPQGSALHIAAVGPTTARAIEAQGVRADYVAQERTGLGLASELKEQLAGRNVLLPRSDLGNEVIPQALSEAGANVTEFVAYRNLIPTKVDADVLRRVLRAEVDVIVFASPSAVYNFSVILGGAERKEVAGRVAFAAIGPTTSGALRDRGLPVAILADDTTPQAIASAIARHFAGT